VGYKRGITLGLVAASSPNITIDTTNGLQIRNNTTTIGKWDINSNITVGQTAGGNPNLTLDSTNGLQIRLGAITVGQWNTAGTVYIGQVTAGSPNISIDPTLGIQIRLNTTNLIHLDASGNARFRTACYQYVEFFIGTLLISEWSFVAALTDGCSILR